MPMRKGGASPEPYWREEREDTASAEISLCLPGHGERVYRHAGGFP